jgi:histidinol-phosphatase
MSGAAPRSALETALLAAAAARAVSMPGFHGSPRRWSKADGSLVTEVDVASERAIREVLRRATPRTPVLGEEQGDGGPGPAVEQQGADRGARGPAARWIVDPIDGTENFARGIPFWGTLIALERDGRVEVAVVDAPALGMRWWADRGAGAHSSAKGRLRASDRDSLDSATLCYGGHHEWTAPYDGAALSRLASRFQAAWGWGNFFGHMLVAEGAADCAVSLGTSVWDVAAPALIVHEAGGAWSDADGAGSLESGSLVTAGRRVHPQAIGLLRGAGGGGDGR